MNKPTPIDFTMQEVGTIDSEETLAGPTTDGRLIHVQLGAYEGAPVEQRDDARYWEDRFNQGEFDREDCAPSVWIA